MKSILISLVLFLFYSTTAHAGEIQVIEVRVVDGDTLNLNGERIRLWGIDTPELKQNCGGFACGQAAKQYLESIISGEITCETLDIDRYGRSVAQCFVGGVDIGALMVKSGWALDYPQYSRGFYSDQQARAEACNRGIWQWEFIAPWEWRRQ